MFSANKKELDSSDNTIVCNDKHTFDIHVGFSIGNLALEGYRYHDTDLEAKERFSFHRHNRKVTDTIEKTNPKEKRPARIHKNECKGRKVLRRQETMPYPKGGTAWTVSC
ncbi:MAG: hypothetical protein QXY77_01290 [Thermoplasmatales archaeon]